MREIEITTHLLNGWDSLATGNDWGKDIAFHGNTKRERYHIQKEEVGSIGRGGLSRQNSCLDCSTIRDSLIRVDALLKLLAIKEVAQELLDLWDTGRTTNKNDLINLALIDVGILKNLGNWVQSTIEGLGVEILETGTGDLGVEVLTVEEGVDFNSGLGTVGKSSLSTLASSAETSQGTGVARHILLGLSGELLLEVIKQVGVEVLSSQMGITSSGLNGEDTTLDVEKGDIESSTTKIVDQDVSLFVGLSGTETVGDSSGSGLVDDTEDVEASNGTSILGSLTLVVVEVGGDGDDGLGDLLAQLNLGDLLHLREGSKLAYEVIAQCGKGQFTLVKTMEEISWGEKILFSPRYSTSTMGEPS